MSVDPIEVLRYARDQLLTSPERWFKGAYSSEDFSALCAYGAIDTARLKLREPVDTVSCRASIDALFVAEMVLNDALAAAGFVRNAGDKNRPIAQFNDDPATSFSDVLDLFDRAIKLAEERAGELGVS